MKSFTKSVLMVAAVAAFVSFASCGNTGANTTDADSTVVVEEVQVETVTAPADTTATDSTVVVAQ